MDVNHEVTSILKSDPIYKEYLTWLDENGVIYPSVILK